MKTKISTLIMLAGLACLIFSTASLAQTDDYQKVQKSVFDPVMSQDKGGTPGLWTGAVSSNWHDPLNWSDGVVPGSTVDVIIPAPPSNQPVISTNLANCKSLTIHPWASLTIGAYYLTIQNDLTVYGALNKNSASGLIRVYGNVVWESGSTAGFTANSSFRVYGDWNFNAGANVNFDNGAVDFMGYSDSWIRCYSDNCSFNNLRIYKSLAAAKVSNLSTDDLVINGITFVDTHATFESFTSENIFMGGDFMYYGSFDFTMSNNDGSVIFNGISQTIDNYGSGSGTFGNVVFSSSIGTYVYNGDFNVARNLTIEQGYFNAGTTTITVSGNWINNAGPAGFIPTSSTIIFESGGDHQDVIGTNTFNNVTQVYAGKYLRFFGPTTIQNNLTLNFLCWAYQNMNINGMLDLSDVGSRFTANTGNANVTIALLNQGGKLMANGGGSIYVDNLVQNYVGGIIEAGTGSLIDITNSDPGEFVDLKGSLYNYGGTINLSGSFCYWPYANGAHLEMTDGIIDIKSCGLTIHNSYTWAHNITGGTIKISRGYRGNRPDFTPTAGTFEFYGSDNAYIEQVFGSTLHHVLINKSATGKDDGPAPVITHSTREKKPISDGGKSSEVSFNSNFTITGNLDVDAGTLINQDVNNTIYGNATINAGGKFEMNGAAWLVMGGSTSLTVNNGGELRLAGDESHYVLITGDGGHYALNVESGGTIGADSAYFEYTDINGVNIKPGALVDPSSAFNSCVFTMGHADGTLLTFDNDQSLQILNARFPSSHSMYNVTKNNNSGVVTFVDYTGSFSGSDHDQDIHNRIHWTGDPSVEITLDGIAVGAGQDLCFEAQHTIVTGGAQNFVVEAFGEVNLVAGESILMLPGTHAQSGSYLHARISDFSFCSGLPLALVAAMNEEPDQHNWVETNEATTNEGFIKVFPNPARDIITLELTPPVEDGHVVIEVYNLMGQNLMNKKMEAKPQYQVDLTGLQGGVYLLRVTHGKTSDFARVIKQ